MENANQVKLIIPFKNKYKLQEFMDNVFPRCSLEKSGIKGCFAVRKPEVIENPIFMPSKSGADDGILMPAKTIEWLYGEEENAKQV